MNISFWKCFAIFGIVSRWADKALADGKVTLAEALGLVMELAALLGVTTLFELPAEDITEVSEVKVTEASEGIDSNSLTERAGLHG